MLTEGQVACVVLALALVIYFNSIFCGFAFDDLPAIKKNEDLKAETPWTNLLWNDYWGRPMAEEGSHRSYRPVTVLTFKLNNLIFGEEAWHYHAVNTILHALCSVLYLRVCLALCKLCSRHSIVQPAGKNGLKNATASLLAKHYETQYNKLKKIAYVAAVLFAVHPVHCEAVTGVVGRAELLSAIFMLLAVLLYAERGVRAVCFSILFCIFAVLSKEQGITVVGICIIFDLFVLHKLTPFEFFLCTKSSNIYTALKGATLCFAGACFMWWRFYLMGGTLPHFTRFDNPAAASSTPARQMTYNYLLVENFMLLLSPTKLLCDWSMGTVELVTEVTDARNLATVALWCFLLALAWKPASGRDPHAKLTTMALSMLVLPLLPASNLFFTVGFVIAERVLYAPSLGFCLLVAIGGARLSELKTLKKVTLPLFCTIVLAFSAKTIIRNTEWASDYTLFQSGLQVTKNNAKLWNNVGHFLEQESPEVALLYYAEAARVQPNDIGSHMNVGRARKLIGDFLNAEKALLTAKNLLPKPVKGKAYQTRIAEDHLKLFVELGNLIKMNTSRLNEVDNLYKQAVSLRADFVDGYVNRGEILMMMNRLDESVECYQAALKYSKKKDDMYFNLGVVYTQMGNISGAVEQYTYAIQANPNHIKALYNSAVIFEETRDPDLLRRARIRIDRILSLEPDNYLALSLLGSLHLDNNDEENAVKTWTRVLNLHPDDKSSLFNMAMMYSKKDDKVAESFELIERLLSYHPNHVKGLMLYGDLLLNKRKDTKGSSSAFSRIIALEPLNIQARHNYCVVMLQEGRLLDAEKCMSDVHAAAPTEKYVADNLAIIQRQVAQMRKQEDVKDMEFQRSVPENYADVISEEPAPKAPEPEEDFVYVEPMRKKSRTEKAKDILTEIEKTAELAADENDKEDKLGKLEDVLQRASDAIKELGEIKEDVDEDFKAKCPDAKPDEPTTAETQDEPGDNAQTEDLRKKALDFLDELEQGLA